MFGKENNVEKTVPESTPAYSTETRIKGYLPAIEAGGELTGYRFGATGVFGYAFYFGRDLLCETYSLVVPSPDVYITGHKVHWISKYPRDTIRPGLTRPVYATENHRKIGDIIYRSPGKYEINGFVQVSVEKDRYLFSCDDEPLAQIHRYARESEWKPESIEYEYTPYFQVSIPQKIDTRLKLLILTFPMLRFDFMML